MYTGYLLILIIIEHTFNEISNSFTLFNLIFNYFKSVVSCEKLRVYWSLIFPPFSLSNFVYVSRH